MTTKPPITTIMNYTRISRHCNSRLESFDDDHDEQVGQDELHNAARSGVRAFGVALFYAVDEGSGDKLEEACVGGGEGGASK